jgi:hypothetical protein
VLPFGIYFVIYNFKYNYPFLIIMIGFLFNATAIITNKGMMPTFVRNLPKKHFPKDDGLHICYNKANEVKFHLLTDIFLISIPSFKKKLEKVMFVSIGDLLIAIGLIIQINMLFII